MNFSMQRGPPRKSMLGTHGDYNFQLLPNPPARSTKSMLGTHRSYNYSIQVPPDSVSKSIKDSSTYKSSLSINFRNGPVKPRKSMLGTHKIKRDSMLPFLPDQLSTISLNTTVNHTSSKNENDTNDETISTSAFDCDSTLTKENVSPTLTESKPRPSLVADVRDTQESIIKSRWSLSVTGDQLHDLTDGNISKPSKKFDEVRQVEENASLLELPRNLYSDCESRQLVIAENKHSPRRLETTSFPVSEGILVPVKRLDMMFSPESNNDSFVELETMMANEDSILASVMENAESTINQNNNVPSTSKETSPVGNDMEDTLNANSSQVCNSSNDNVEMLALLKLMDAWIERNTEVVNTCTTQMEELQRKIDSSNKEIEDIKNMKQLLLKKFKFTMSEKENLPGELEHLSLAVKPVDQNLRKKSISPVNSPSRQIIQEMRSTIKFLKTPRAARAPRKSVMLTPHSMSFCIQSQFEQLLE